MKLLVLFVFSISFVFVTADSNEYECKCTPLQKCSVLFWTLQVAKHFSFRSHWLFTEYLKAVNCGYIRHQPLVCCPESIPSKISDIIFNTEDVSVSQEAKDLKSVRCFVPHPKKAITTTTTTTPAPSPPTDKLDDLSIAPKISLSDEVISSEEDRKNVAECGRDLTNRNRGMGNQTELSDFPWLALLEYDTLDGKQFLCGGVLISDQHILTSADCVTPTADLVNVRLGEYNLNESPDCMLDGNAENTKTCINATVDAAVGEVIVHEGYKDGIWNLMEKNADNIAIIKLKEKVELSYYVQPICLPRHKPKKQKFTVAGWGRSSVPDGEKLNQKLMSKLTKLKSSTCDADHRLSFFNFPEQICAGIFEQHEQACIADSGGPLMGYEQKKDGTQRLTVFGISIMQTACGVPDVSDVPGVFLNVYKYRHWIKKHMK